MAVTERNAFSFGALLKAFRKRRHITQQQLANNIGVHHSAIIRWEQGDYLPESKTMVLELARHLRLDDQETRRLLEASLTALAPHWLVSLPRNPFFTGREEVLEALHRQLGMDQAFAWARRRWQDADRDACCELHPRAWSRSAELWQVYEQWAAEHQERYPLSRGAFIRQLKAHGCRASRTPTARIWRGIALVRKER